MRIFNRSDNAELQRLATEAVEIIIENSGVGKAKKNLKNAVRMVKSLGGPDAGF